MVNIKKLNKALVFVKNRDFDSAEKLYYELLKDNPNDDTALSFWGMFNLKKGFFKKAEKILESAYKLKRAPSTIAGLAYTKFILRKYDDAIILYEELFRYDKNSEKIYQKIIECFRALNMYDFAGAYCKKYLMAHPDNEHALVLMTQNYMDIADFKTAEEYCAKTMELYPDSALNWINAGLLQELLYCNEEIAQECYKKAIENKNMHAWYHLAVSLRKSGRYADSENALKKALEFYPEDIAIKSSLGFLYLLQRKFEKGFEFFIKREESPEIHSLKNRWKGKGELAGDTILVYSDQGLGDGIQFSRYLPYLKEKFSKVIVYTRTPLTSLLINNFQNIDFVDSELSEQKYDSSILITDIPYYLGMDFSQIPYVDGFLNANQDLFKKYKTEYFNTDKKKIGLCWRAGGMGIRAAINRTINIEYFKPLLELNNVEFYSFQVDDIFDGCKKYPQIIDVASSFKNFDDTAAAMKNLDLMISADTACIHLAGALGVKSKLLIPYCADWRWFDNTEKTEWYSSIDIIKQVEHQDWFREINILTDCVKNYK